MENDFALHQKRKAHIATMREEYPTLIKQGPDGKYVFRRILDRTLPKEWREHEYQRVRQEFGYKLLDMLDQWPDPVSISYDETIERFMFNSEHDELKIELKVWSPQCVPFTHIPFETYDTMYVAKTMPKKGVKHMNENVRDALIALVAALLTAYLGIEDTIALPIAVWLVTFILGLFGGGAIVAFFLRNKK